MLRHLASLGLVVALVPAGALTAAESPSPPPAPAAPSAPDAKYSQVTVNPTKTSIYLGTVSLTVPPLSRRDGAYAAEYRARVFPFFFFSEHGNLAINFSADELRRLRQGEVVPFQGHAANSAGEKRRIEGRAVPDGPGADHGKIKIRVWAGKIELIFNSTYRFTGAR